MQNIVKKIMHFTLSWWPTWQCNQGVQLRVHLMVHLRIHLAISIKMHKRESMWVCTKECTWDCTWDAPVVALCGPVAALESAIDGGLNVGFKWPIVFESNSRCTIKRQRGCTWRFDWFNYKHFSAVRVLLMVDLKTYLHFRLKLRVHFRL